MIKHLVPTYAVCILLSWALANSTPRVDANVRHSLTAEEEYPELPARTEERKAYQRLQKAIATHPGMKKANVAEVKARQELVKARNSGHPGQIALAQNRVLKAANIRFQKAAAIPELRQLIEDWRDAVSLRREEELHLVNSKLPPQHAALLPEEGSSENEE